MVQSTPNDGRADEHTKASYELLIRMLTAGLDDRDQMIEILNGNAKSFLTAGTVFLGVISAGMGVIFAELNANESVNMSIVELLKSQALIPIIIGGIGIIGTVLTSILWSVLALRVVKIDSPFSSKMLLTRRKISERKIEMWEHAGEIWTYRKICEAYALALQNREKVIKKMEKKIETSQVMLIAGLVITSLTAAATVITLALPDPI